MSFVCDPVLTPGVVTRIAKRTVAGDAIAWQPGGDVAPLVAFLGDEHVVAVGDVLYRREGDNLTRINLAEPLVFFIPVAGDRLTLTPDEVKQQFAAVADVPIAHRGDSGKLSASSGESDEAGTVKPKPKKASA